MKLPRILVRAIGRQGASAIEMAVILPTLLVFVFGVMEVGWLLWTQVTLDYAVEQAARCNAIDTTKCGTAAQTQAYAVTRAFGLVVPASTFTVTSEACGKKVTATLPFTFLVTKLLPGTVTVHSAACYPA